MNTFLSTKSLVQKRTPKLLLSLLLFLLCFLFACTKKIDYFDYVSELRSNVLLAKNETFSLRLYAVAKESPYAADGVARPVQHRFEAYLLPPDGTKTTSIGFSIDGKEYGGEMSYDNVKGEYFFACNLDGSALQTLDCKIVYGKEEHLLRANSVRSEKLLTPREALSAVQKSNGDLLNVLTDEYGFAGEIYLRLLYEATPYYYVGIIDREGNIRALLMNAETGKILARRDGI